MNIFYFVSRWPRYNESARSDKIMSMIQSLLNIGHHIHLISSDPSPQSTTQDINKMPIELVCVNPNKIMNSLVGAAKKPDIALFNSAQLEHMYSIFLFSKWNKCLRVLELNKLEGVEKWRKANYKAFSSSFIHEYDCPSHIQQTASLDQKFSPQQLQSIIRSDYYFCCNDFISNYLKKNLKTKNYIVNSSGIPINDFCAEVKDLQFREWRHRKNFVFIGNFNSQKNIDMINNLAKNIWPLIRKELKSVELHIYGSGYNKMLQTQKKELEKQGILLRGVLQDTEELQKYKALLYPIQYSCQQKGAIVQSWFQHLPVVTTPIGAEGLFLETSENIFSALNTGQIYPGFFKERTFTKEQEQSQIKIRNYYDQNILSEDINRLQFGGLCNSYNHLQFTNNAVKIYTDEAVWKECLEISRKSLLKNQSQLQFEVNLKYGLSQIEIAAYDGRRKKEYKEQWDRYLKKQGHGRLQEKKAK